MTSSLKRKFCKDVISKWRSRLFLGEWFIDLIHATKDHTSDPKFIPFATCRACPVYMEATITIYPSFWSMPKDRREHILVHELSHCITQSIWNVAESLRNGELCTPTQVRDEIEILTQRIANIAYQQEWG